MKGGTLRNVTRAREGARERKKLSDNLLVDIAFDPSVVEECLKDAVMERMLIELSLNFVEEYCDMLLNKPRWVKLEGEAFLGPESDLHCSLDEQWRELLSKASKLDVGDSILRELKAGDRKAKTSGKCINFGFTRSDAWIDCFQVFLGTRLYKQCLTLINAMESDILE